MLEIIGPQWAEELRKRHGDEMDFVRIEIESATAQIIPVIPVLVGGASVPNQADLVPNPQLQAPSAILKMLERNAHQLREGSEFQHSVLLLIANLEEHHGHRIAMIWCPPGSFLMGTPRPPMPPRRWWSIWRKDKHDDGFDEHQHQVALIQGFWLAKYPVTQAQWEKVMGINPSDVKDPESPVVNVSWEDAVVFCKRLSAREGGEYRLPTEEEWEYACRAGSTTNWCFGDDEEQLGDYAWFRANSSYNIHRVGLKKPNAWGLHDMHGNVWEWCQDWYREDIGSDPQPPSEDEASGADRVNRGGSWFSPADYTRSAHRDWNDPSYRGGGVGLRLARSSACSS